MLPSITPATLIGFTSMESSNRRAPPSMPPAEPTRLHHELWFVSVELLVVQTATLAIYANLPRDVTGWAPPKISNIAKFAAMGPHFDDDRWGFNYVGHPLAGSEYFLLARNRREAFWQAFLYSAAWSTFWEYVTEGPPPYLAAFEIR